VGSQISRPYQVALVGAVLLVLAWFVALRPKGEATRSEPAVPRTAAPTPNAQRPTPEAQRPAPNAPSVLVLLFWNHAATDDRAVHSALRQLNRHHGRVATAEAPIADVGQYKPITAGVSVLQSPTVIVLDTRTREARTIAGYADVRELDHAVAQALAG
jgi:hypothetical protein